VKVLYEDNHLLVVVKPVNMPTQEDSSGDMDLLRKLKEYIKETYNKPGNVYLGLVHRLDRPVGGVMVFAKTSKAASRLSNSIRERTFQKKYIAIVHGTPKPSHGKLTHYVVKDEKLNKVYCVSKDHEGAKEAILEYSVVGTTENLSLIQIHLHTGRPHQIRVQMKAMDCPLYGDQKYGAEVNKPGQQIALWSMHIGFEHPTTKEQLNFYSLPVDTGDYPWTLWNQEIYKQFMKA
jgi:23S rRNA pseudouridine1911/1915/1917 synthase